jgi:hypothetical protein
MERRCGWWPSRAIDVVWNVAELDRGTRPRPVMDGPGPAAVKRMLAHWRGLTG